MPGEKTEKATPKRKEDERKKGNVFLSKEVVTVVTLLAMFFAFKLLWNMTYTAMEKLLRQYLVLGATLDSLTVVDFQEIFMHACVTFAQAAMPLLVICVLTNVVITFAQTKMLFSAKAFGFKANRMDPLKGIQKMFAMRSLVELIKSILKITVLIYIIYSVLKGEIMTLPKLMDMGVQQAIGRTGEIIWKIAWQSSIAFIFLAAGDYFYQWWDYEKNLRMSKQEIKDEYKQMEGDPQVKGRLRSLQQQRARNRMMQNVPQADVVVRNPTHYAVALRYDQTKSNAPVVVAKGMDSLALRIIAVAEENGVYITENRPLARALYETVEIDQEIPGDFYQAIAEVLAFVYNRKQEKK